MLYAVPTAMLAGLFEGCIGRFATFYLTKSCFFGMSRPVCDFWSRTSGCDLRLFGGCIGRFAIFRVLSFYGPSYFFRDVLHRLRFFSKNDRYFFVKFSSEILC